MSATKEAFEKLVKEKEEITKNSKPLQDQRNVVRDKIRVLEKEEAGLTAQINIVEKDLYSLSYEIAGLARLLPNHVKVSE